MEFQRVNVTESKRWVIAMFAFEVSDADRPNFHKVIYLSLWWPNIEVRQIALWQYPDKLLLETFRAPITPYVRPNSHSGWRIDVVTERFGFTRFQISQPRGANQSIASVFSQSPLAEDGGDWLIRSVGTGTGETEAIDWAAEGRNKHHCAEEREIEGFDHGKDTLQREGSEEGRK